MQSCPTTTLFFYVFRMDSFPDDYLDCGVPTSFENSDSDSAKSVVEQTGSSYSRSSVSGVTMQGLFGDDKEMTKSKSLFAIAGYGDGPVLEKQGGGNKRRSRSSKKRENRRKRESYDSESKMTIETSESVKIL